MTSVGVGPAMHDLMRNYDSPRVLSDVILSRPLRGDGTTGNPFYRSWRLTTLDGTFLCEIEDGPGPLPDAMP